MKALSVICLLLLLGSAGCSEVESSDSGAGNGNSIPEGGHWRLAIDGDTAHEGKTLVRQYVSGKLALMATGGPGLSGFTLVIPIDTDHGTGTFETGIKLTLSGISELGSCKHKPGSISSSVTLDITTNTADLFVSTLDFTDLDCKKGAGKVSGSGTITQKLP